MSYPSSDGQGLDVERAEPMLGATSSSVLRSEAQESSLSMVGRDGAPGEAGGSVSALPSQESDNCIGENESSAESLSPYRRKSRHRLIVAIEWMVKKYGLNQVGLLTLTFGVPGSGRGSQATQELRELAKDLDFVQNRWHSLNSNIINKRYADWICIPEPHRDGVWHLHVVAATKMDIRTGTDVETLTNYKLPYWMRRGKHLRNEALATEWQALRQIACKYRFGRIELLPIKKTGEALARYLAGYLSKAYRLIPPQKRCRTESEEAVGEKKPQPKRHRLIRFSRGISRLFSIRFSVRSLGNLIYRTRLKMAASMLHFDNYSDFADYFGPRWNYYLGDLIAAIPIPMVFGKVDFERGIAAKILNDFAENPFPYLDEENKKELVVVNTMLLRKFTELACDEIAELRWQKSEQREADNIDVGPLTEADLQNELIKSTDNPF